MTLIDVLLWIVSVLLVGTAFLALYAKSLMHSIVILSALSVLSVLSYVLLRAPDVALTEAVIGSGMVTALFVFTLLSVERKEAKKS